MIYNDVARAQVDRDELPVLRGRKVLAKGALRNLGMSSLADF